MDATHTQTGQSLAEWLKCIPNELPFDAVGLWQIVPTLRHNFGLSGHALDEAVALAVQALMEKGAIPVECGTAPGPAWVPSPICGRSIPVVAAFVVDNWVNGSREPTVGDLWFVLPDGTTLDR